MQTQNNAKAISTIEYRISQIKLALTLRDKLPRLVVDDYDARLDELETLLNYIRS